MPFIQLPALMGILSLFAYSPDTAQPMSELAEILLRSQREGSTLTSGERELIAAYVSSRNNCTFCTCSHAAAAAHHLNDNLSLIQTVLAKPEQAPIGEKLKALLAIAGKVQIIGTAVTADDIRRAQQAGATDREIHDTVLIAAAFCMYNRYVDGLATLCSANMDDYKQMGIIMADVGYINHAIIQ